MKRLALLLPLLALSTVLVLASCLGTGCVLMANLGLMRLDSERRLSIRERVAAGDLSVLDKVRKSDVNYVFDDGGSLLLAAVSSCDSNMVAALIARGADVNQPFEDPRYSEFDRFDTSRVGQTPLHWAVGRMVARDLFRHPEKADRAHPVRVGLHVKELNLHDLEDRQVEANLIAIVSILLENGAKPDVRTEGWFNERQTALAYALALEDPYPVLDILIKGGSDPNQLVLACQSLPDSMERDLAWWQNSHGDRPLSAWESAWVEKNERLILYLRNAAESKPHAESAEAAEPRPGEAGPLLEGAAERSEAGGVSHAEPAEGTEEPAPAAPADKPPLKVLAIGNSFSQSLCPSLFMAAEDAGEKLEFCNLCIGGCSLKRHAENIAKAGAAPGFAPYEATWYRTDGYAKFNANVPQMLATQAWDVVTIQQASHESWNPGSFHPWADAVVAAVRSLAPGAEIVVHETWSYNAADARIGGKFPDWPFGQAGMYSRLETNYLALARSFGLRTIPVGLAVQKRRAALAAAGRGFDPAALDEAKPLQDPDLRGEPVGSFWWDKATAIEPDRPMRRDTIHLNKAGQYLQTMTWLGFLFGRDVRASDGYPPSSDRVARFLGVVDDAAALRAAAQDALDEAKSRGWQDFAPKKAGGASHAESAEPEPHAESTKH